MTNDRALWITWYDLPEGGRDDYLAWLHEIYMPGILDRTGLLWAAHFASEAEPVRTEKKKPRRYPPAPIGLIVDRLAACTCPSALIRSNSR